MRHKYFLFLAGILFFICAYATINVTDDIGNNLCFKKPAARIITLSPSANEILLSIGAKNKIIASVEQADIFLKSKKIISVGYYPDPDFETIVSLKPDLIVMPAAGMSYGIYQKLNQFKIPVYILSPKKLADISQSMKKIGKIVGREKYALNKSKQFLKEIGSRKNKGKKVFYELWNNPLTTIGKNTIINEIIKKCGGENIFSQISVAYPTVSIASVIKENPDIIFVSNKSAKKFWQQWHDINAVKNNKIIYIKSENLQRNSPRILLGMKKICRTLAD